MTKNNPMKSDLRFAFFGTPELATIVLDELESAGYLPTIIITTPDQKQGRGMKLTASPVKLWAQAHAIDVIPASLDDAAAEILHSKDCEVFIVVAYGKIIPQVILDIPPRGTFNIHPSLLPRFRGASPVRSAILADEHTGVTVMQLDAEMDHGPIIAQKKVEPAQWPPHAVDFEKSLMKEGGRLLAQILPHWITGDIEPQEQNHDVATYCGKIEKEDGLLDLAADPRKNLLKIRAYEGWPGTYAYFERGGKKIRVAILDAHIDTRGTLVIDEVKPEGKKEMQYEEFMRSGAKPI
jgi:methionyl-tRNA formyltransferase